MSICQYANMSMPYANMPICQYGYDNRRNLYE